MTSTWRVAIVALVLSVMTALALAADEDRPRAQPAGRVLGVGLGLFATDPGWDYRPMLREIAARGATDVLLVVPWHQRDVDASVVADRGPFAPTELNLQRTAEAARGLGLSVGLMPIVHLDRQAPGRWRGTLEPAGGAERWMASYATRVLSLARVAQQVQAERLVIGSELIWLEGREDLWRTLAADIRLIYGGKLSYSANWDHYRGLPFADALDEVGVTGYFELAEGDHRPSRDELVARLSAHREQLRRFRREVGKPVLLTEVGWPSLRSAASHPWSERTGAELDPALQARLYAAFCEAFGPEPSVDGVYFWNWFGWGGPTDRGYTPRGKPAAGVMERCLRSASFLGSSTTT